MRPEDDDAGPLSPAKGSGGSCAEMGGEPGTGMRRGEAMEGSRVKSGDISPLPVSRYASAKSNGLFPTFVETCTAPGPSIF